MATPGGDFKSVASVQDYRQNPVSAEDLFETGFQHRCNGEYEQARNVLSRVLEIEPGHTRAKWQLALIKGFEGDFDGSLEGLKLATEEAPNDTNIRYDYAMTLMMLGECQQACEQFKEILRQEPNHEKAKQQIAYCE